MAGDVALRPGEEIVDADDVAAALEQLLAQMRTEEPGAAGDENTFFEVASKNPSLSGIRGQSGSASTHRWRAPTTASVFFWPTSPEAIGKLGSFGQAAVRYSLFLG